MTSIQIHIKDGLSSSTAIKGPCRVSTTANITLTGEQTIDGVAVVTDDRVLVKDQTTASENGIYVADTGPWRRSKDFNKTKDVKTGSMVNVTGGTAGAGQWQVTTADPIVVGTTNLTFATMVLLATQLIDEDDMASDSATKVPSQQSTKAYVDAGPSTAALQATMRERLDTGVYVTLAALPGLNTAKDALAYVTDFGQEGWFKWDGTDLSVRTVIQSLTTTTVTPATDTITKVAHLLSTGSGFVLTGATANLAANTVYYAIVIDADNFKAALTPTNAIAGTAIDLTATTNFTLKQLRDPLQRVYVIKTGGQRDGTAGAWVKSQGAQDLGISTANYHRFNDRILLGLGATGWMGDTSGMGIDGAGSWLRDEIGVGGTTPMAYLLINAGLASVPDYTAGFPRYAVVGASRTPTGANSAGNIGVAGFASGHATSGSSVVWGGYFEAVKTAASNSTTQGLEVEVTNLNSTPVNPVITPEATYVQGRTFGIFLATGGGPSTNPTVYDADVAIFVGSNTAKFRTGLTFFSGALTKDVTTNYQHAILLPTKARVEWYTSDATGNYAFTIHSEISTAANSQYLIVQDGGMFLNNANGGIICRWQANTSATGNYPYLRATAPGTGPILAFDGGDTNIDGTIRGKGTGGGALQDGASATKVWWNTNGVGFGGTVPRSMTGWSAPTGTLLRTTYVSYAGATHTGSYVQATIQALDDATKAVSQRLAALITDLHQTAGYGLLRT